MSEYNRKLIENMEAIIRENEKMIEDMKKLFAELENKKN